MYQFISRSIYVSFIQLFLSKQRPSLISIGARLSSLSSHFTLICGSSLLVTSAGEILVDSCIMVCKVPSNTVAVDQSKFWDESGVHWDAHRTGWTIAGGCASIVRLLHVFLPIPWPHFLFQDNTYIIRINPPTLQVERPSIFQSNRVKDLHRNYTNPRQQRQMYS